MTIFKNVSDREQAVTNIWVFAPGEKKEVTDQQAEVLKLCPHFEEVKSNAEARDKLKWGKDKTTADEVEE